MEFTGRYRSPLPSRLYVAYALILSVFAGLAQAEAACIGIARTTLGSGTPGKIEMSIGAPNVFNKLMYCDGSNWQDFPGSPTATTCTKNGQITFNSGKAQYCNGTTLWDFDSGSATSGSCTKPGEISFDSGTSALTFCDGSAKRVVSKNDTEPDPFSLSVPSSASEVATASVVRITGINSTNANVTFSGSPPCTSMTVRTCADAACATAISSLSNNGNVAVTNGIYLRAAAQSAPNENESCSITVAIGSQSSVFNVVTGVDTAPFISGTGFGEALGAATNTLVESEIAKFSGFTGSVTATISDGGYGGSPEFRVCGDATCSVVTANWSSADKPITNPSWVQLRTLMGGALSFRFTSFQAGTAGPSRWWASNASCPIQALSYSPGSSATCTCAPNFPTSVSYLSGNRNYRYGSHLCKAAVHAGRITLAAGGSVTYRGTTAGSPSGTCSTFAGSTANGITSSAYATSATSFYFSGDPDACN